MVYTKNCPHCGIWFKTPRYDQIFCSKRCGCAGRGERLSSGPEKFDESLDWKRYYGKWVCPYQDNVGCYARNCDKCGWNPDVAKARLEKYKEENNGQ